MARKKAEVPVQWSDLDRQQSHMQGWDLIECIDEISKKIFFEIFSFGTRFENDNYARAFVMDRNKSGDELAIKALGVSFRSKAGSTSRKK